MLVMAQPSIAAGGVLVDGLDVVVDLNDIDRDAVFVGPFLHDAGVLDVAPGHPAGVDRPAYLEVGLRLRPARPWSLQGPGPSATSADFQRAFVGVISRLLRFRGLTRPMSRSLPSTREVGCAQQTRAVTSRDFGPPCPRRLRAGVRLSDQHRRFAATGTLDALHGINGRKNGASRPTCPRNAPRQSFWTRPDYSLRVPLISGAPVTTGKDCGGRPRPR